MGEFLRVPRDSFSKTFRFILAIGRVSPRFPLRGTGHWGRKEGSPSWSLPVRTFFYDLLQFFSEYSSISGAGEWDDFPPTYHLNVACLSVSGRFASFVGQRPHWWGNDLICGYWIISRQEFPGLWKHRLGKKKPGSSVLGLHSEVTWFGSVYIPISVL